MRGYNTFWKGLMASFFFIFLGFIICFFWVFNKDEKVVFLSLYVALVVILSAFICGLITGASKKFFWKKAVLAGLILAGAIAVLGEIFFPSGFTLQENLVVFLLVILSSCAGALIGANCLLSFRNMKGRNLPGA